MPRNKNVLQGSVVVLFVLIAFGVFHAYKSSALVRLAQSSCSFASGALVADGKGTPDDLSDDVVYYIEGGARHFIGTRRGGFAEFANLCSGATFPPIQLDRNNELPYCPSGPPVDVMGSCPLPGAPAPIVTPPAVVKPPTSAVVPSLVPLVISEVIAIPDIVDPSRVTFQWHTNYSSSSRVLISQSGKFAVCDPTQNEWCVDGPDAESGEEHRITVEGLLPGTYAYVVESVAGDVRYLPEILKKDTSLVGSITIGSEVTLPVVLQTDHTPPRAVTSMKVREAAGEERAFEIIWSPPADADLDRIELFRSPVSQERGVKIAVVQGSAGRSIHSSTSWVDRTVPESVLQGGACYTAVALDGSGNQSEDASFCWKPSITQTLRLISQKQNTTLLQPVTQLSSVLRGDALVLSWQNPTDANLLHLHIYQSRTPGYLGELIGTYSDTPLLPIREQTSQSIPIPAWAIGGDLCFSIIPEDRFGNRQDADAPQACITLTDVVEGQESIIEVVAEPQTKPAAIIATIDTIRTRETSDGEVEVALLVKGEAIPNVARLVVVVQSERQEFAFPPSSSAWRKLVVARMFPGEHEAWVEGYDTQGNKVFVSNPRTLSIAPPVCNDGQDNDGDGFIDYPEDDGCAGFMGDREDVPRVLASVFATPQAQALSDRAFVARTKVEDVRSDPTAVGATEDVVSPVTAGSVVVPILSVLQLNRIGLLELPHLVVFLILWLLEVLRLRPRRRRWGQVYDAVAKATIPFARVKLYLPSEKQFVAYEVANNRGEYGFPVQSSAGEYYLQVVKSGFSFPTHIVTADRDARFGPVYHGEQFDVKAGVSPPHFDVPLDPWSRVAPKYFRARIFNLWYRLVERFVAASPIVLLLGVVLAAIAALIVPTATNTVLFVVYLLLAFVYFLSRKRSFESSPS
ncbi:MAG: fibronectin type III domain-containing protein [bacterium]|nr:fibronectin type III domain-containing protein [bacterium]